MLCCTLTQSLLTILLGTLMEVLAEKGLRIIFWLERILLPLSTRGQAESQHPPPPGQAGAWAEHSVLRERLPAPTLQWHTMAAFSPMTFSKSELYTAVSSPSPKGSGMGGISSALEKDCRGSHPDLTSLSYFQSSLLPRE